MADQSDNNTTPNEEVVPALPEVSEANPKTVGDDNFSPREPEFEVVKDEVDAQVTGKPEDEATKVKVHEVHVTTDTVITDTSDPLAVQIPDAGRGSLDLPIHELARPTVEQFFAEHASKADDDKS
jgi:hypothetical protein